MSIADLSDEELNKLVDSAHHGEGPGWLLQLTNELATVAASENNVLVESRALSSASRRRRRLVAAAVTSAVLATNLAPLAADEMPLLAHGVRAIRSVVDVHFAPFNTNNNALASHSEGRAWVVAESDAAPQSQPSSAMGGDIDSKSGASDAILSEGAQASAEPITQMLPTSEVDSKSGASNQTSNNGNQKESATTTTAPVDIIYYETPEQPVAPVDDHCSDGAVMLPDSSSCVTSEDHEGSPEVPDPAPRPAPESIFKHDRKPNKRVTDSETR